MESAFAWLNQLIEAVFRFCPRIVIVRATHAGVSVAHSVMWRRSFHCAVFSHPADYLRHIILVLYYRWNPFSPCSAAVQLCSINFTRLPAQWRVIAQAPC